MCSTRRDTILQHCVPLDEILFDNNVFHSTRYYSTTVCSTRRDTILQQCVPLDEILFYNSVFHSTRYHSTTVCSTRRNTILQQSVPLDEILFYNCVFHSTRYYSTTLCSTRRDTILQQCAPLDEILFHNSVFHSTRYYSTTACSTRRTRKRLFFKTSSTVRVSLVNSSVIFLFNSEFGDKFVFHGNVKSEFESHCVAVFIQVLLDRKYQVVPQIQDCVPLLPNQVQEVY